MAKVFGSNMTGLTATRVALAVYPSECTLGQARTQQAGDEDRRGEQQIVWLCCPD